MIRIDSRDVFLACWLLAIFVIVGAALVAVVDGRTITDLENDLARLPANLTLDELAYVVGVAWGYDVDYDGIVTLDDGIVDLEKVSDELPE